MRRPILICIAALFYYSGLVRAARWWMRCSGQHMMILNYHQASGGNLRRHLIYLRKHYRIMHIDAALEELYTSRNNKKSHRSRRRTPLVLTFDDGYSDNYTHAYPLARELQVPFTIYLVPGYIETGDYFWWIEGERLVSRAQNKELVIEGQTYNLQEANQRKALMQVIDTRARHAQSVAEREAFLAATRTALAVPTTVTEAEMPSMPLSWEQIREMEESGWVSFGAHTMHHPILAYLTDAAEIRREITGCRGILEHQLGHPICSFAYPVGQMHHIGDEVREMVREAGYDWALTTQYGFNTCESDPSMLRRVEADVDQHWLIVAAEAACLWGVFSRLRWLPFIRKHFTNSYYTLS